MREDWILDVLADLRGFARNNGFVMLEQQLEDTARVAATELASLKGEQLATAAGNEPKAGEFYRCSQPGGNA